MSKSVRSSKRPVAGGHNEHHRKNPARHWHSECARSPLMPAAMSLASVMLAGTASAQETALPTVDVLGAEGTGGYQTTNPGLNRTRHAAARHAAIVNVVPQQVIREQNATTVRDALRNVAGITFRAGEGGNQGDTPYIRGFSAQNDIFRDGVRDPGWYTRDTFAVDAVEVYKGPSSVLFGRGSTGGVINLITKTPLDRNLRRRHGHRQHRPGRAAPPSTPTARSTTTSRPASRSWGSATTSRAATTSRKTAWASRRRSRSRSPTGPRSRSATSISTTDSIPDYGIPFLSAAWGTPRHPGAGHREHLVRHSQRPYPDTEKVDAHIATAKIEHELNNDLKVTNTTRYSTSTGFQRNVFPEPNASRAAAAEPERRLDAEPRPGRRHQHAADQPDRLAAPSSTPAFEHTHRGRPRPRPARTRDFLRNSFTGCRPRPTSSIPIRAARGGTPRPPTATQQFDGDRGQRRRLHRRPDQAQPSISSCSARLRFDSSASAERAAGGADRAEPVAHRQPVRAGASARCSIRRRTPAST